VKRKVIYASPCNINIVFTRPNSPMSPPLTVIKMVHITIILFFVIRYTANETK